MAEYIDKAIAVKGLRMAHDIDGADFVSNIPAADVRENVRARWVVHKTKIGKAYTTSSNCNIFLRFRSDKGTFAKLDMRGANYCPNCGAHMVGGAEDD